MEPKWLQNGCLGASGDPGARAWLPEAPGGVLEAYWGRFERVLRRLGGVPGASWAVSRRPGSLLGRLLRQQWSCLSYNTCKYTYKCCMLRCNFFKLWFKLDKVPKYLIQLR